MRFSPQTFKWARWVTGGIALIAGLYLVGRVGLGEYFFRNAQQSLSEGRAAESYELQQKAIKYNPISSRYRRQYALTNLSLALAITSSAEITPEQKNEAASLVQQAVREAQLSTQLKPGNYQNWQILGQVYRSLFGVVDNVQQPAVDAYRRAIEENINDKEQNASLRFELGMVFFETENYEQAMEMFEQTLELKSDHADAHYYLAKSLSETGETERAKEEYELVLELLEPGTEQFAEIETELNNLN